MIIPKEKDQEIDDAQKQIKEVEKQYRKGVITPGERYNKIIDIWTHCTDQIANVMFKTLEHNQGKKEYNPVYLMVDSGARGNRQQVRQLAGVRGLMAKPSGDIIEKPILVELPRGPHRAGILHLHPRRPQGSGRHRAQDRRLRLHDPQARGCGPGRHHPRGGLRHRQRHLGLRPFTKAKTKSSSSATASSAGSPATTSSIRRTRRKCSSAPTRKLTRSRPSALKLRASRQRAHPLRAHLRKQARHLRPLLWPQPGHRRPGQARRGRRHHRRPIHRRAGHAAHHAHVPHRRHGVAGLQAAADQGQARRHRSLQRTALRRTGGRQQHRPEQERLHFHPRRRRPRTGSITTSSSARSSPSRTAARSRRARPSCSGTRTTCRFFPKRPAR